MSRLCSTTALRLRELTKAHRHPLVTRLASPNAIWLRSVLGATSVRRVSSATGSSPSVSLVLAVVAGLPIALWTYKVGLPAV